MISRPFFTSQPNVTTFNTLGLGKVLRFCVIKSWVATLQYKTFRGDLFVSLYLKFISIVRYLFFEKNNDKNKNMYCIP